MGTMVRLKSILLLEQGYVLGKKDLIQSEHSPPLGGWGWDRVRFSYFYSLTFYSLTFQSTEDYYLFLEASYAILKWTKYNILPKSTST